MAKKRGVSYNNIGLDSGVEIQELDSETKLESHRKIHTALKVSGLIVLVIAVGAVAFQLFSYYSDKWELQRKEDLMWQARYELSTVEGDKTVNYLRLHNTRYEDGRLKMDFLVHNPGLRPFLFKDSVISVMFHSVVSLNREHWTAVAHYLEEAGVDAELTFIYRDLAFTKVITHSQLAKAINDEGMMKTAMEDFALFKTKEVLDYTKQNYKDDSYITPDSTTLTIDYVTLYLSFDDSIYYLDKSLLDTTRVGVHFTDRVGDMGSILDGMLAICSRTDRGFAFVYKGTKKNTTHILEWNRERTLQILSEHAKNIWQKGAETNRAKTYVVRGKKEQ